MESVLGEISKLRKGKPIIIDYHNSNRYRLVLQEENGSKTAYYFNTPIYNSESRKMIDVEFESDGSAIKLMGSDCNIAISDKILMQNSQGSCVIDLSQRCSLSCSREVHCGNFIVIPTTNGIALKCAIKENEKAVFTVEVGQEYLSLRTNDKCFALMREHFTPFAVFSSVGSVDPIGNVIAPAKIEYQKLTESKFRITVSAMSPLAQFVLLEANLYENKLFQDTTVESMNPYINNAFGGTGFIGNSVAYGEQWLYSRFDYSNLSEIIDKRVEKVVYHIPRFNNSDVELSAHRVSARFCSFGSNWNNKIMSGNFISNSISNGGYHSFDFTDLFVDKQTNTITKSEGFILKPKIKGKGFSVISTGDSCFAPQIIEINFI